MNIKNPIVLLAMVIGVLATAGLAVPASAAGCTDGVDCFCDRMSGSNILMCEDFEKPNLANGGWMDSYGPAVGACSDSQGTAFGNGSGDCLDIVNNSKSTLSAGGCGVSGERNCVLDGNYALGHRMRPNKTGGIVGTKSWKATSSIGLSMAVKWSANYKAIGTSNSGPAHKMNQFGTSKHALFGISAYTSGTNTPFGGMIVGGIPTSYNVRVGRATSSSDGNLTMYYSPDTRVYDWGNRTGDGPGNWECLQLHVKDWGSSNGTLRVWMNGKLATHVTNLNMTNVKGDPNKINWNNFYNGSNGRNSGYPGTSVSYRYEDNFVVTSASEPVSCSAMGFDGIADIPTSPPPPPSDPPAAPVLLD